MKYGQKFIIAEVDSKSAGFLILEIEKKPEVYRTKRLGFVHDLFVTKQFRGKGISTALKNYAITYFKKRGIKHVKISANVYNRRAREIYRKWKFFDYMVDMRLRI